MPSPVSTDKLNIAFFGKRNSGKSSLLNLLAGQSTAIVSNVPGTTTDPVAKAMELPGLGACILTDTAGFDDDDSALGALRVGKTADAADRADVAILVFAPDVTKAESGGYDISDELNWLDMLKKRSVPVLAVVNKSDIPGADALAAYVAEKTGLKPLLLSASAADASDDVKPDKALAGSDNNPARDSLREAITRLVPEAFGSTSITGALVKPGDVVLLVMPQDSEAPKGRLILPQVQTIRDLLDRGATTVACTADGMKAALDALAAPPALIITDSQAFRTVWQNKPAESKLTSFSILFAAYKGDLPYYAEGAAAIDALTESSRVLIAECCTHAPLTEDIGRVKLPALLRKKVGLGLQIDFVSGTDYPADLTPYDLVIQCGACMFNRRYVLSRIGRAKEQSVPMTNYGVALAALNGILGKVELPGV